MIQINNTLLKFGLTGLANTLIGMSVIFIAWHFFGFSDLAANLLGYGVGFMCSYAINRVWTFSHRGSMGRSFWRFALVCAVAYIANLLVLFSVRGAIGEASFLPHVAGSVVYTIIGYLGSRFFAFKSTHETPLADVRTPV